MAIKSFVIDRKSKKRLSHKFLSGFGLLTSLIIVVLVALVLTGCSNNSTQSNSNSNPTQGAYNGPLVVYEITGTAASVDVMINKPDNVTENYTGVAIGTKYPFDSFGANWLYITAKNLGETGSVTVNIYYKGKVVKTATAEGAHVMVEASYFK